MNRPKDVDVWDGIELKRDESLTDEQRKELIRKTLKEVKESAERFKREQKMKENMIHKNQE